MRMIMLLISLLAAPISGVMAAEIENATPPWAPTSSYELRRIEGWPVRVLKTFTADNAQLCSQTLKLLAGQLAEIERRLPAPAVARLRKVTIWVEELEPHHPCMAYHPSPRWLREHGMNPEKGGGVEIANARNFLSWTLDQPVMVLHELAHAYMDQFLEAAEVREIEQAFQRAGESGKYEKVLQIRGRTVRHYALNNAKEYFAEGTEALFGANDFYPFVRAELKRHDPELHELLERLWRKP